MKLGKIDPGWDSPPPPYPGGRTSLFSTTVPLGIIKTYRFIPPNVRSLWSFGSSNSHLALASPSWTSLFHYGTPRFGNGGWDDYPAVPGTQAFKSFTLGWLKLGMVIPLLVLSDGWSGDKVVWGGDSESRMADGPNWETSPPSR
jgi:hypothetical protein